MKKSLFILLTIFSFFQSSATNIQGIIYGNVTWTIANSPYHVIGNVLIDSMAKLTIEPGVEVLFDKDVNFYIEGAIAAVGAHGNMIHFACADSNAYWKGFEFRKQTINDSVLFQFCHFDSAAYAIKAGDMKITLKNCLFEKCNTIYLTNTTCTASNNIFKYTSEFNFHNYSNGTGDFSENEFIGSGLRISGAGYLNVKVTNNYFHDMSGLALSSGTHYSEISGNTFINNNTALYLNSIKIIPDIKNNVFAYNVQAVCTEGGSYLTFRNNTFKYNEYAVYIKNAVSLIFNYNCFNNNSKYNVMLKSISKFNFDFTNNYWGKTDSSDIHDQIYDFHNDLAQAIIHYIPFLTTEDSSCQKVTAPCHAPSKINITSVTNNSAVIDWDSAAGSKGYQYIISLHPAPSSGAVVMTTSALATGLTPATDYYVCVRNICEDDTSDWVCENITTDTLPTSVSSVLKENNIVTVSPNPFHSSFELKMDTDVKSVVISDLMGKKLLTMRVNDKKNITVDMQVFPAGVYIYQVAAGDGTVHTGKIMKQ